jgi:deoxyribose-phosphate aldolase
MVLTAKDIAAMMDLSCVRTNSCKDDILALVEHAKKYQIGHVSIMQCYIPLVKELLKDHPEIKTVGNVSFPSGSDSTSLKVLQAKEMIASGCDEIDVVMNVGELRSGDYDEVAADLLAVVETANMLPVKVIIEMPYLNTNEIKLACEMCIQVGATFVKTGTGWADRGTTVEDIKLIKSIVGDRIKIKAAGGIRDLQTLTEMYRQGARRFGVNLKSGKMILDEAIANSAVSAV